MGIVSDGVLHLSAREATEAIIRGAAILDVREEYHTDMKIFQAERNILCPASTLQAHLSELPHDVPLIVADATGLGSKSIVKLLLSHGFSNIANLAGGIMDWERDGFPVVKDPSKQLSGQCPCMLKRMKKE